MKLPILQNLVLLDAPTVIMEKLQGGTEFFSHCTFHVKNSQDVFKQFEMCAWPRFK